MASDSIARFLASDLEGQYRILAASSGEPELRTYLGDAAFEQYRATALHVLEHRGVHLAGSSARRLIFIPGIMGSILVSKGLSGVWWVDALEPKLIDGLKLSPDGARDAREEAQVEASVPHYIYAGFLTAAHATNDFFPVAFAYDWRKLLTRNATALRDLILAQYEASGKKVHVVAHSMGGMMLRCALLQYGKELWPKIERVVFIATPHYGAPAIAGYLKKHLWGFDLLWLLGKFLSRETFRSMWGVLSLLPAPAGIYPQTRPGDAEPWHDADAAYQHPCSNFDLYDAAAWDLSLDGEETTRLQTILTAVAKLYGGLTESHLALEQQFRSRMAVIAGVGYEGLYRLEIHPRVILPGNKTSMVTYRIEGSSHRDGDGRVPLVSAELEYVGATRYAWGKHDALPMIPEVYADAFRWLRGEKMQLSSTRSGPLQEHLDAAKREIAMPDVAGVNPDDGPHSPGYLKEEPSPEAVAELESRLNEGRLPEFGRLHIL